MNNKPWFHAQIRWAVLQEGKRGLLYWKESAYLFQSEDHQKAFRKPWRWDVVMNSSPGRDGA